MILCKLLFRLAFSGVGYQAPQEKLSFYHLEYCSAKIDVSAPSQKYPRENIIVTVKAAAIIEINVKHVRVTIYGALNATNKVTLRDIIHLENCSLTSFSEVQEAQYKLTTPKNISTGLTYGEISC